MVVVLASLLGRFSFVKLTNLLKCVNIRYMGRILLVDFMYLWNRLYYAYSVGKDPSGYYKHIFKMFEALNSNDRFDRKYIILDGVNGCSRQKELLENYKAGRVPKKEVYERINELIEDCRGFKNLKFMSADNYEADEIIASWARYFRKEEVYIYSGDKDLIQLTLYKNVHVGDTYRRTAPLDVIPFTDEELDLKVAKISNNTLPNHRDILKFRVFRGDASDKIPAAVPRLKSSDIVKFINRWDIKTPLTKDILKELIDTEEDIKLREKLEEHKGDILRNYELMNLIHLPFKNILEATKCL